MYTYIRLLKSHHENGWPLEAGMERLDNNNDTSTNSNIAVILSLYYYTI